MVFLLSIVFLQNMSVGFSAAYAAPFSGRQQKLLRLCFLQKYYCLLVINVNSTVSVNTSAYEKINADDNLVHLRTVNGWICVL